MTFPPSDSPDWTGIPGALRYLGSIDMSAGVPGDVTGTLAVVPASYDGVIYVVATGDPNSTVGNATVELDHLPDGAFTNLVGYYRTGLYKPEVFSAFINAAIGGTWQITANIIQTGGSDWTLYVFAAPAPNVVQIGPTQGPILVQGVPVWERVLDAQLTATPAPAANALITFGGVANRRWQLAYATWTLTNLAAVAAAHTIRVRGSVSGDQYASITEIPAVVNSIDREQLPAKLGITIPYGEDMLVDFLGVPAANVRQRISAGGILLPEGF